MYFITPSKPPLSLLYHYFLYYFLRCTPVSPLYEHHRSIRLKSSTITRHPFPSIHFPRGGNLSSQHLFSAGRGDGKRRCYVKNITSYVKKNHVVRKNFYVASIFGGAAGRKNRPPWKKLPTAWELSSTAGTLSPTASLSVRDRTPAFLGGRSNKFTGHRYLGNKPVP